MTELLEQYSPSRTLRSSSKGLLKEKKSRLKKAGDRAFSISAPKLWNNLPEDIVKCANVDLFKKALKTYYFKLAYK